MTFKVCNHGSKQPYLVHKMSFVDSQFGTTVVSPQGENIPIPHFSRVHMVEEGEKL